MKMQKYKYQPKPITNQPKCCINEQSQTMGKKKLNYWYRKLN